MEKFLIKELVKRGVSFHIAESAARQAVSDKVPGDVVMKAARIAERLQPGFKWTK